MLQAEVIAVFERNLWDWVRKGENERGGTYW